MDKQANIPALGKVCYCVRITELRAKLVLFVPKGRDPVARLGQFAGRWCREMRNNVRLCQIVP